MARSPLTFELWAAAHEDGDEYYRHLTASLSSGLKFDEECARLAVSYLNALENLEKQLQTIEETEEVRDLKESTAKFLELVRQDLKRFKRIPGYEDGSKPSSTPSEVHTK